MLPSWLSTLEGQEHCVGNFKKWPILSTPPQGQFHVREFLINLALSINFSFLYSECWPVFNTFHRSLLTLPSHRARAVSENDLSPKQTNTVHSGHRAKPSHRCLTKHQTHAFNSLAFVRVEELCMAAAKDSWNTRREDSDSVLPHVVLSPGSRGLWWDSWAIEMRPSSWWPKPNWSRSS